MVWDWSAATLGAIYALPGALVILSDRSRGLALVLGVLPAAIVGLMPTRRGRLAIIVLGAAIGFPMFIGGLLAGVPVLAVAAIAGLGIGAALLAARARLGQVAMTLSLPMVGVGLSYPNLGKAAGLAGLMVLGSIFGCVVSMFWPERAPGQAPAAAPKPTLGYGVRLGAAGATAAAIGFLLDLEHVGWACAAALLVMRPAAEMQRLRSVGRIIAVAIGALAAIGLVRLTPAAWVYSLAAIAALAALRCHTPQPLVCDPCVHDISRVSASAVFPPAGRSITFHRAPSRDRAGRRNRLLLRPRRSQRSPNKNAEATTDHPASPATASGLTSISTAAAPNRVARRG